MATICFVNFEKSVILSNNIFNSFPNITFAFSLYMRSLYYIIISKASKRFKIILGISRPSSKDLQISHIVIDVSYMDLLTENLIDNEILCYFL